MAGHVSAQTPAPPPTGMVSVVSGIYHRLRKFIIRALLHALRLFIPSIDALLDRLARSPGIPVLNPTTPYWLVPPSPIATHGSEPDVKLPEYADIVIIGSGITGTSVARTILDWERDHRREGEKPVKVVMLEARETCSGATGRNGGHITPLLYAEYEGFKAEYGEETAKQIIRFRLSHLPTFLKIAEEEGLLEDSQCREVDAFDIFHDPSLYRAAKQKLDTYRTDMPSESAKFRVHEGEGTLRDLQLAGSTVGALSTVAGAIHPYRLVTGILSRLLREYSSNFHLFTQTPCTAISTSEPKLGVYTVATPKGPIRTLHIVHATNGWISHLLPGMRGKIVPARGVMTAQRPSDGLGQLPQGEGSWAGTRSFVFFPEGEPHTYDYLTQQPAARKNADTGVHGIEEATRSEHYPTPNGEFMLGGAFTMGNAFLTELGDADDRGWNEDTGNILKGALDGYFSAGTKKGGNHVKSVWSGILGVSVDSLPWVGRIPNVASGRSAPGVSDSGGTEYGKKQTLQDEFRGVSRRASRLAAPGEWMAAGYSGEGMVHAWLSGTALAYMVLGLDAAEEKCSPEANIDLEAWFPRVYRVNEERWQRAGIEDLFASYFTH